MRKSILIFLFALLHILIARATGFFDANGIYYSIIEGTTQVEVANGNRYSSSVVIPSTVAYSGTTYTVTSIGMRAFLYCSGLTSVTIPESVTSIGEYAFDGCSGLTSVTIPNSVDSIGMRAFQNCSGLTSVTIGEGVTSIEKEAFDGCSGLTSVEWNAISCQDFTASRFPNTLTSITFGDKVKHIPNLLCWGCAGLTSVTIPDSVTSIGEEAFYYCSGLTSVTIGESVTSIGNEAFFGCSGLKSVEWNARHCKDFSLAPFLPSTLTSITFGDKVERIPAYFCHFQNGLTSVTIPNSVTAIGENAFDGCWGLKSVTIPNSVTSIGSSVFANCSGLTSVTIGEGVTSIGEYAFSYCSKLTSVTIPNSVTAIGPWTFKKCGLLMSVTIGDGVTTIGESAFVGCESLTSVTIPNSVTSIGNEAFKSCSVLKSVTIPNSVTAIGEEAFANCGLKSVTIGEGMTSIGYMAFKDCMELASVEWNARNAQDVTASPFPDNLTSITFGNQVSHIPARLCDYRIGLTSVTIGEGVTTIGDYAFEDCKGLTSVEWNAKNCQDYQGFSKCLFEGTNITSITFGDKVERIPAYLCYDQGGLKSVTIPNSVTAIGSSAFTSTGLTSVTIPNSVDTIGSSAFAFCDKLTSVTIGKGVTTISTSAFRECTKLTSVTIPKSVTSIGDWAFKRCGLLMSVTIGDGVTTIGESAFEGCEGLTSVTIPKSVTSIGNEAFADCDDLTSVTIGGGVTTIGDKAFAFCDKLTSVLSLVKTPPTCGSSAFSGVDTLYVRCGCKADYETAAEWSLFSEIIEWCVYTVTLQVNDETMGSATGDKEYAHDGTQATLTAIPNVGYHFVKWDDGNTDNPRTLTVTKDTTLTAEFAINIYTVTVNVNDATMGTVSGGNTYAFGSSATLEAVPNPGYHFVKWSDDNLDNPRVLTVSCDTTFTAEFAVNIYTVAAQPNDADMGRVDGGNTYAFGSSATLEAVPNPGYHFVKWSDDNTDNPRTLTVTQDTTFTAEFAINTFTVSVSANNTAWGSVSQSGNGTYDSASSVTITATPNEGYSFLNWTKGNEVFTTDSLHTFVITENLALVANFEKIPDKPVVEVTTFTVSISANNTAWGSVSQSGNGTYDSASSVTITATPNEGYRFVNWTKGNAVFSAQADTTFTIKENLALLANFEKIPDEPVVTFTVSVSANNTAWGSVSQSGNGTYDSASSVTITATPNEGYRFIHWTKGNEVFTTDSLHTFVITENLALVANFEKIPDKPVVEVTTFTVSISANNTAWGSVSQSGNGTYDSASSVTITATPNEGYRFINWTKGEAVFSTQADTTFKATENLTLVANFEKIPDNPTANENSEADNFRVYVQERTIYLSEDRGSVQVYNMAGKCVYNGRATAIPVPQSGVYILVAGSQRLKVLVR